MFYGHIVLEGKLTTVKYAVHLMNTEQYKYLVLVYVYLSVA